MGTLHIYVDSSTKPSKDTKYGESIAAWFLRDAKANTFYRGGVHYFHHFGPNKTFYEGIIHALESALTDVNNGSGDPIKVHGDCELVIEQLRGTRGVDKLRNWYTRVKALEGQVKKSVTYHYLNETDATYRKVDQLSKRGRGLFRDAMK